MKRQGISLITLVITIVIVIIIAGAVILNLADKNPIKDASQAVVMEDIDTFRTELMLKLTTASIFDTKNINAVTKDDIIRYVPSMENKKIGSTYYTDIFVISEGELKVDGTKANEAVNNGKLSNEQYNWIVEGTGNNVFNAQTYSIKYYLNDGTENYTESNKIHNVKYSILANSTDRENYGFTGWNTSSDGTGIAYNAGDEYTENAGLVLYAQWKANTFTVTYYQNDGTEEAKTAIKNADIAYEIVNQDFTRAGYTFDGWNTNSSGTGTNYASGASYTLNANLSLYAKWKKITYTVTYNANNGTGAPNTQTKEYGTALTLSTTKPTRTGYNFAGWNTIANEDGTDYNVGASYTGNANLTLYAKWRLKTLTTSNIKAEPKKYYGTYINYTPKNGCPVKWRVFYADSTNIYLIADDYVENKYLEATGLPKSTSTTGNRKDYCVYSSSTSGRQNLVTRLTTSSYYTEFKDTAGKAASVVGAPTLEMYKNSYNAVNTDTAKQMDILNCTAGQSVTGITSVNVDGYVLRFGNTGNYAYKITVPSDANKRDLYIRTDTTNATGMWLGSLCAISQYYVMYAYHDGCVGDPACYRPCWTESFALRPLVTLNSNVKLVDPDGDGVYDLQ